MSSIYSTVENGIDQLQGRNPLLKRAINWMSKNIFGCLCAIFLASLLISLLAIFKSNNNWELPILATVIESNQGFYYMIYACIALTIPGIIDCLFDSLTPAYAEVDTVERLVLLLSVLLPCLYVGVCKFIPSSDSLEVARTYAILRLMQQILFILPFSSMVLKRNPKYFPPWLIIPIDSLFTVSQLLRTVYLDDFSDSMASVDRALFYTAYALILMVCLRYWVHFLHKLRYHRELLPLDEVNCFVISIVCICLGTSLFALDRALKQHSWREYGATQVTAAIAIQAVFTIAVVVLPGRISRLLFFDAQRNLELKRLFVRHVSHEIRTPLNIAIVGLDLLTRTIAFDEEDPESMEHKTLISEVQDSCKVAVTIIDDLLAYEKLDAGLLALDKSIIEVCKLIRNAASLFNIQARGRSITLSILQNDGLIGEGVLVEVDVAKIAQVLRNFLSNAIKFSPEGSAVRVEAVRSTAASGQLGVLISVVDAGIGISAENIKKLFKEIVQFDPSQNQGGGGSGLGLWISHRIVDLHRGEVRVTSEGLGHGSTFSVWLPVLEQERPPVQSSVRGGLLQAGRALSGRILAGDSGLLNRRLRVYAEPSTPTGGHRDLPSPASFNRAHTSNSNLNKRVLVVDDSAMNRKMMVRLLQSIGYAVDEAEDGLVCVRKVGVALAAGTPKYAAVLIDNLMPNLNGTEATLQLRAKGYTGLIIGVTGNAQTEDVAHFKVCGADDVLCKPVDAAMLEAALTAGDGNSADNHQHGSATITGGGQAGGVPPLAQGLGNRSSRIVDV